jgi:hypothetical protein
LFELALASPLPYFESGPKALILRFPQMKSYQETLQSYNFRVAVDNLALARPLRVPSDRDGTKQSQCIPALFPETVAFRLKDGSYEENVKIKKYDISVTKSDLTFRFFELQYEAEVNGQILKFVGYLFQQTGRLFPKEIQGVLVRLRDVAIGGYSADALTYPYAEGPRFTMITAEILVSSGLEDALNIDRDSFNTLEPHYLRLQAYIHSLLHDVIFPESWVEEKARNKRKRLKAASASDRSFVRAVSRSAGKAFRSVKINEAPQSSQPDPSPVEFDAKNSAITVNRDHPLVGNILKRKKRSQLAAQILIAFEEANKSSDAKKRRKVFYKLLQDIFQRA